MSDKGQHVDAAFFEALMKHIMQGVNVPKVQIERIVGPILGFFIENIMSRLLNDEVVALSAEFPLRKVAAAGKKQSLQSTNIDWLMYGKKRNELIFVELKTNKSAFRSAQGKIYGKLKDRIDGERSAQFLMDDLAAIGRASRAPSKYSTVVQGRQFTNVDFSKIDSCRIIYILPDSARIKLSDEDRKDAEFHSFAELSVDATDPYKKYWDVLHDELKTLDG